MRRWLMVVVIGVSLGWSGTVQAQEVCTPALAADPQHFEGQGVWLSPPFRLQAGLYRSSFGARGSGNFIGELVDERGAFVTAAANDVAPATGSFGITIRQDGTYYLNVTSARGPWTIDLQRQ